jgi:hypothetical protein
MRTPWDRQEYSNRKHFQFAIVAQVFAPFWIILNLTRNLHVQHIKKEGSIGSIGMGIGTVYIPWIFKGEYLYKRTAYGREKKSGDFFRGRAHRRQKEQINITPIMPYSC